MTITATGPEMVLRDAFDWPAWFALLQIYAQLNSIWSAINPDTESFNQSSLSGAGQTGIWDLEDYEVHLNDRIR